eukprot:SAG11_NODE_8486_length_1009_cov_8.018681_1_plen_184_part_10
MLVGEVRLLARPHVAPLPVVLRRSLLEALQARDDGSHVGVFLRARRRQRLLHRRIDRASPGVGSAGRDGRCRCGGRPCSAMLRRGSSHLGREPLVDRGAHCRELFGEDVGGWDMHVPLAERAVSVEEARGERERGVRVVHAGRVAAARTELVAGLAERGEAAEVDGEVVALAKRDHRRALLGED